MLETWPTSLPGPLVNSNAYRPKDRIDRGDVASGAPLYTLNDDDGWVRFDVTFRMTTEQAATFRTFYRQTLQGGSKSFTIPLAVDGMPGVDHTCYFDGVPRSSQSGKLWTISATLLAVEEVGIFGECDTQSLIAAFNGFSYPLAGAVADMNEAIDLLEDLWQP